MKEFGIKLSQTDFAEGGKYAGKTYAEAIVAEIKNHGYEGASEKLSQTFAGRLSTLKGVFLEALATATGPLFEKVAAGLGALGDKIKELTDNGTLQAWTDTATAAFNNFWAIGQIVFDGIINAGKWVIDNWGLIGPIVAGVLASYIAYSVIVPIIEGVKVAMTAWKFVTMALAAEQGVLNFVLSANPIGLVVIAIGLLVAAGYILITHWKEVTTWAQNLWTSLVAAFEGIKTAAVEKFTAISNFITGIWNAVKQSAITVWDSIKAWISLSWAIIKAIFTGDFGTLRQIGYDMFNNIWEGIKGIWNSIKSWVDGKVSWLKDKLTFWKSSQDKMSEGGASFIGSNAQGTDFWRGGLTMVGEQGPELLNLPRGSQIIPNDKINNMAGLATASGSGTANIFVQLDGYTIAKAIGQPLTDIIRVKTGLRI